MAKFSGKIGFAVEQETAPGVWGKNVLTKRNYKGDVLRDTRNWQDVGAVNDNLNITNRFSIVADTFAYDNIGKMRCIEWMGTLWKITSVDVQRPRLILSIGEVYRAEQT